MVNVKVSKKGHSHYVLVPKFLSETLGLADKKLKSNYDKETKTIIYTLNEKGNVKPLNINDTIYLIVPIEVLPELPEELEITFDDNSITYSPVG